MTGSSQVESIEDTASHTIKHFVVRLHLTHLHWLLVLPLVPLILLLEALDLLQQVVILSLNGLLLGDGIFLGGEEEALLLIPLGSVGLVGEDHFSLFRLNLLGLLLKVSILLLQQLLFSFELLLHFIDLLVTLGLGGVEVLGEAISFLHESLELLFESTMFSNHALGADLKLLVDGLLFFLQFVDVLLVFLALGLHLILDVVQLLLVFDLKLRKDGIVVVLVLHLGVLAVALELVNRLLEQSLLILVVFLVLLFLLLEEIKFASPESLVLLKLGLDV